MAYVNLSHAGNSSLLNDELENEIAGLRHGTEYLVFAPALGIVMLVAIFGNMALIVTICRTPRLRTRTNMFILNQACADVGVALLCMPFSIVTCFTQGWVFGDGLCQLNGFMNILFEASSLFTLTAIGIEKYFSIIKPMAVVITTRLAWIMIAMTWFTALVLATIPLTGFITFVYKPGSTQCGVLVPESDGQTAYAVLILVVAFLMPLCIMGFCYINIFRAARQHNIRVSRMSLTSIESEISLTSQKQIALTIFIMLIVFIICWTPFFSYMMYMSIQHIKTPDAFAQSLGLVSYWFAFLNSSINPFVYGVRNPLIRKELYSMCCQRFQNDQQAQEKGHASEGEPYSPPPQPHRDWNKTFSAYPSYINAVTLSEEDVVSPNEGIGKPTMDRGTQTAQAWRILSIGDLPHIYFTDDPSCLRNETLPNGFTSLASLHQNVHTGSANELMCSTCSSACCESDHVMISGVVTCSSESEIDSLCSGCQSNSECSTYDGSSSCEGREVDSNLCSSLSDHTKEHFQDDYHHATVNSTKGAVFLSTTTKAYEKSKIIWMETQL